MAYFSVEEHWRLHFLMWRGGIPNFHKLAVLLAYDIVLAIFATAVVYQIIFSFL